MESPEDFKRDIFPEETHDRILDETAKVCTLIDRHTHRQKQAPYQHQSQN